MSRRRETPLEKWEMNEHQCNPALRLEKLGMVPFFRDLDEAELEEVNQRFRPVHYASGDTIYSEGEKAARLRVVAAGNVRLVSHTPGGKDVLIDLLKPGEFFGPLADDHSNFYTETARAHTNACVLTIGLPEFRNILNEHPGVALNVLGITEARLRQSRDKVRQLSTATADQRVARLLLDLEEKFGEQSNPGSGRLIQLPLSRKDIADMTGITTETSSRIVHRFEEMGYLNTGRKWMALFDRDGLVEIAEKSA